MTEPLVTVVGVGALGSHAVQFLRNQPVGLRVIDFDRVEQRNLLAQFHGTKAVGKSKVQSIRQSMQFLFGRQIDGVPHRLRDDNANELLGGSALVLDCLDNLEARGIVSGFARDSGTPCLHGALAPNGEFGRVVWDEHFTADGEGAAGAATCENGEHLPFIAVVGAYLAMAASSFLVRGVKVGYQIHPGGVAVV